MCTIANLRYFLPCIPQSFAGTSRARIVPLEMYPPDIKIKAVCESNKSTDPPARNGLAVAVQHGSIINAPSTAVTRQ